MRAVDLIKLKRDGGELSNSAVRWLIEAYTEGEVGDDQMAAFAMAVFFRGMSASEVAALTESMMRSGNVIDLGNIAKKKVDKHSTGGVGDKISICLAPLVAACGVPVPMISGRGLGHTGGTLDKLSAIPGFSVEQSDDRFVELVATHGIALIGQTATLAPADKKLYALRDVTATVESVPLITASILSKKLAEGIDGLVLDVKCGSGAFMKTIDDARTLARSLVSVGKEMGRDVRALITSMDQVLGAAVGNANETWEAIEVLKGRGPQDVIDLTVELGAEMLVLGDVATDVAEGRVKMHTAIEDGSGLEKLEQLASAQGGDPRAMHDRSVMAQAPHDTVIGAQRAGVFYECDVEAVGRSAMLLGAGRARSTDVIDLGVGLEMMVRLGDTIEAGQPLARVFYNDNDTLAAMREVFLGALSIGESDASVPALIRERI